MSFSKVRRPLHQRRQPLRPLVRSKKAKAGDKAEEVKADEVVLNSIDYDGGDDSNNNDDDDNYMQDTTVTSTPQP